MTKRFRMVAGPNGSGKSTLVARLVEDYAVNFYTRLNADEVFAQVKRTGAFFAPFPIDGQTLSAYVSGTQYADVEKARFFSGEISVDADCVRFVSGEAANSYTVALLVNFLQDECTSIEESAFHRRRCSPIRPRCRLLKRRMPPDSAPICTMWRRMIRKSTPIEWHGGIRRADTTCREKKYGHATPVRSKTSLPPCLIFRGPTSLTILANACDTLHPSPVRRE